MSNREPSQITLTVFAARNLQSKRKGETCHASVVFGLGKNQYLTETVVDNCPEWNQEAVIPIPVRNQNHTVKFKVRDKEHVLGVVLITLKTLGSHRESSKQWLPLTPSKKNHEVSGELLVECFVSQYRPGHITSQSEKCSPDQSHSGSQEDLTHLKKGGGIRSSFSHHHHHHNPSWNEHEMLESASLQPKVTGISPHEGPVQGGQRVVLRGKNFGENEDSVLKVIIADVDCTNSLEFFSSTKLAVTTPPRYGPGRGPVQVETVCGGVGVSTITFAFVETEIALVPEVTGVSPREGPVEGGQRVILRGSNLGECKEDVVRVVIADVDCTETLEYFSPVKLVITTLPRSVGTGEVLVETARGGVSNRSLTFTYMKMESPSGGSAQSINQAKVDSRKQQHEQDQAELKALKQQIKDLKEDNSRLREQNQSLLSYIDTLILSILEKKPDILEIKTFQTSTINSQAHRSF